MKNWHFVPYCAELYFTEPVPTTATQKLYCNSTSLKFSIDIRNLVGKCCLCDSTSNRWNICLSVNITQVLWGGAGRKGQASSPWPHFRWPGRWQAIGPQLLQDRLTECMKSLLDETSPPQIPRLNNKLRILYQQRLHTELLVAPCLKCDLPRQMTDFASIILKASPMLNLCTWIQIATWELSCSFSIEHNFAEIEVETAVLWQMAST